MRSRRPVAACAIPALFVALLVVAGSLAASQHSSSAPAEQAHHAVITGEVPLVPTAASALDQSRRNVTFGALVAYLALALSVALALLLRIAGGFSSWALLPSTGLARRGRAPPFAGA